MTDKLIMTTEQREQSLTTLKEVDVLLSNLNQSRHRGLEAAITMLQSLPMVDSQQVAWHTEDHLTDRSATTYNKDRMQEWMYKGWPVTPLYTSPQALADDGSDWFYQLQFICRVLEGVDPAKQDKATALGMARSLKQTRWTAEKALTPISADDVTYKMMVECNNNADSITRADFAAAVNTWIKHRSEA